MMDLKAAVRRVARPIYGPPRYAYQYARALRILRTYEQYYRLAKDAYRAQQGRVDLSVPGPASVGVEFIDAKAERPKFRLPSNYSRLLERVRVDIDERLSRSANCLFFPPVSRDSLAQYAAEVPEVKSGQVITIQLRRCLDIAGISELAEPLVAELQERAFGSYAVVDKIYVYRSLVSRQREQVSWLWHWDNHPPQILKVMIYLTDVDERSAPFEFLRERATGKPLVRTPRPLVGNSRVPPDEVERYLAGGYERHKVVGPAGSVVVFDHNVVHKANIAEARTRDVLVFQIRPAAFRPPHAIDPAWTGSFEHDDFNRDPSDHAPHQKRQRLSY